MGSLEEFLHHSDEALHKDRARKRKSKNGFRNYHHRTGSIFSFPVYRRIIHHLKHKD